VYRRLLLCGSPQGRLTTCITSQGPLNGAHMLVMPVGHIQSLVVADEAVRLEMKRFRTAIRQCFSDVLDADTVCGLLYARYRTAKMFFERNYRTQHMQLNCVGVPRGCDVGAIFKREAANREMAFHDVRLPSLRIRTGR